MQTTGIPLLPLIMAVLLMIGGICGSKKMK
jgi:hypothetical protein